VLVTGIMGGLLAVVYVLGRRSLAPYIVAHFLIAFAFEPGLLLAAVLKGKVAVSPADTDSIRSLCQPSDSSSFNFL
jgi:hypothetical protein